MKLSLITVNLNNKDGLQKTINSVVSQTFKDFEWILIDGGSTDGSKELIEQFSSHISYWVSEPDKGIYNAMNKGILKAKGEYCLFLNSGDYFADQEVLDKVFAVDFDEDVVYGNQIFDYGNNSKIVYGPNRVTLISLIYGNLPHSGCSIFKRVAFDKFGLYDESLKISSDWKWLLLSVGLKDATTRHIDVIMSVFDMNGISVNNSELGKNETNQVLDEYIPPKMRVDYEEYMALKEKLFQQEVVIRNSKAYRLGNAILKPLKFFRNMFK